MILLPSLVITPIKQTQKSALTLTFILHLFLLFYYQSNYTIVILVVVTIIIARKVVHVQYWSVLVFIPVGVVPTAWTWRTVLKETTAKSNYSMATHDRCKRNVYPARIVKKVFENIVQKVNMAWIMAKPSIHVQVDVNRVTTVHWEVPAVNKSVAHLEGTAALTR